MAGVEGVVVFDEGGEMGERGVWSVSKSFSRSMGNRSTAVVFIFPRVSLIWGAIIVHGANSTTCSPA